MSDAFSARYLFAQCGDSRFCRLKYSMVAFCIFSLLLVAVSQLPTEATAQLIEVMYIGRSQNRITLQCRENTFGVSGQFWVRRPGLQDREQLNRVTTIQNLQDEQIVFEISQDLEGAYSCSRNSRFSDTLQLVAFPSPNTTIPLSYVFLEGQAATIHCRIMPGRLRQYYSVRWWNGSVPLAASSSPAQLSDYQLHENFSLTINDIQLSDSSTNYHCMVTIDDPQAPGTNDQVYRSDRLGTITVTVYARPSIEIPPAPRVIAVNDGVTQNTTFFCQAVGDPRPVISWMHNGQNINRRSDERFQDNIIEASGDTIRSRLNVTQLRGIDSGSIDCVANSTVDNPQGRPLSPSTVSSTTLTVLTGDFDVRVVITVDGDVQFFVTLLQGYLIPELTRLRIKFTSEEDEMNGITSNTTSTAAFVNTERILYQIPSSEVPFQRFRVQVAQLVDGLTGPFVPRLESALVFDKTVSTENDPCIPVIAGSILGIIVVAIIVIIIVIVIVVCLQHLKFKKRACQRDKWLELEEKREQEEIKEAHREVQRNWSQEKMDRLLDELRDMRETVRATNDAESYREFMSHFTRMTRELYGKFLSFVAMDGDVATDSEEERNKEMEREQKEQLLDLLRHILKGGRRNKSLKAEMLETILDEVGSDVNDYVDQKLQRTIMEEVGSDVNVWESQSTHLESTNFISDQQQSMEARKEAGGSIRGVEMIGETAFTVPNQAAFFEWKGYGLKLCIPEESLPVGIGECRVNIRASFSGQFQLPENSELLSPVFWILAPCRFTKPVTLEIQHCALTEDETVLSDLVFVSAMCSQRDLPYTFKQMNGGSFTTHSSYGSIQLNHFSGIGVAGKKSTPRSYCAHLYHSMKQIYDWRFYLAITLNHPLLNMAVKRHFNHFAKWDTSLKVAFQKSEITLNIPEDGIVQDGWKITPMTYPVITKRDANEFKEGQWIPQCELMMEWNRQCETPVRLHYKVILNGAKGHNYLRVVLDPAEGATSGSRERSATTSKPELKDLLDALYHQVADKWKILGVLLEIPKGTLASIEASYLDPRKCLLEMLETWLNQVHPPPTWAAIVDSVDFLGEKQLGNKLRHKYLLNTPCTAV